MEALAGAGRFPEAEKIANEMIAKDKTFTNIYDWLYVKYTGMNEPGKAESAWKQKVQNNPKQPFFIVQLAGHYFLVNRKDEMTKTLQQILDNPADFPLGRAQVGDFYMRTRDIDSAVKHYEEGLRTQTSASQKATYQKRLFETLIIRGRKQEALDLVTTVLKDNPKDNDAIAMRASLWVQDGSKEKVQAAISELNSVIVRSPENVVLRYNLGRAYLSKGDVEPARIQFQEAIKYKADFTPARLGLAQLHLAKSEFTKAMQAAEEILAYEPQNVTALMIRTSSRMGLGDLPTARQELTTVLAAQPNFPDALFQMGILNFQEKKYKDAEANFLHLMKTSPNDPRGLVGRVETLAGSDRYDEAIQLLNDELAKNPDRSFYRLTLANVAVRAQKYDIAVNNYKKLLEKNTGNFDVQLRFAEALRRKGNIEEAIKEFHKARELNPNDSTAYVHLALLYEGTGRTKEARPLYEQILKLDPDNAIALNNLAFVLAETGGDLDMALTMAQRAKAKFPAELNVTDTLGWVYIKKNLSDQAVKLFSELVQKDANNPIFRYHFAVALAQKGDKGSAKRECERALQNKPSRDDEAKIRELLSRI
jgi:tetratricopeptide (TPR) repeat protein